LLDLQELFLMIDHACLSMLMFCFCFSCSHALRLSHTINTHREDQIMSYMQREDSANCPPWSQCPEVYVDENLPELYKLSSRGVSMLMGVFTGSDHIDRRHAIRGLWKSSRNTVQSGHDLLRRFVICNNGNFSEKLRQEAEQYNDMIFLECQEGYRDGLLTTKVASFMKYFVNSFPEGSILFKTDDDTYVDTSKLLSTMARHLQSSEQYVYAGLQYSGGRPIRDKKSFWYEPFDAWSEKRYPRSMAGGPGYLLSYALVQDILKQRLPESYHLYNEDKAVGVWVHEVERKTKVDWVRLSATDGYQRSETAKLCDSMKIYAKQGWKGYPFIMQHHLSPQQLQCFSYEELRPSCFC